MQWFILSLLCAVFEALKDISGKKGLQNIDEYIVAWSWRLFALPILLPILFFIDIPKLNSEFFTALVIGGILNLIVTVIYIKSIKISDLSLTLPMISFTPLFLLITSPLILGEFPNGFAVIGILLIILGAYVLNLDTKKYGLLEPFKALLRNSGTRLMLLAAFLWSISANFDKIGINNSSPLIWVIFIDLFISVGMIPIVFFKSRKKVKEMKKGIYILLSVGVLGAVSLIFQMAALELTMVSYVIAIKRTSILFAIFFSYFLFREEKIKERFLGALIMVLGVAVIAVT